MKDELYSRIIVDSPMRFTEEQLKLIVSKITDETKVIFIGENGKEKVLKVKGNGFKFGG